MFSKKVRFFCLSPKAHVNLFEARYRSVLEHFTIGEKARVAAQDFCLIS